MFLAIKGKSVPRPVGEIRASEMPVGALSQKICVSHSEEQSALPLKLSCLIQGAQSSAVKRDITSLQASQAS
jgi:hypothetical protein